MGFPEDFFGIVTFVTLCAQSDGTSVGASVRAPSFNNSYAEGRTMNAAKQSPRTASEMPRPSKPERILVVKEEETSREIIASMLTRAGYECQEAGDGLEALALLDLSKGFDLLLAGLTMPNLAGRVLGEQDLIQAGMDVYGFGPWHIDDVPFAERKGKT